MFALIFSRVLMISHTELSILALSK